jgi:signal transduction histidine kinase/CheY-like chemotaxis protein
MTGISRDQAIGALASDLYPSDNVPYLEIYAEVVATASPVSFEAYFPPMEKHFIISVFSPFKNRFATVFQDKTRQKKMEEQLRHTHKMEAVGTLAGGIAHEFNNMLGIIIGNAELALDDSPEWNPASDYIREIKTASLRAQDVVRKLLSFARKTPELRKPVQMGSVIKESLDLMRTTIPASIDIRKNIACSTEMILGDPDEISQILINLCTNSVHAMAEESGVLEVGLDTIQLNRASARYDEDLKPGDYVRLRVKDTGKGIDPAFMDRLFDPYFTTKDVDQGLGMGLAVVHGIVKKHDGAIKIESEVGKGTTVDVLFPLIENQTETGTEEIETLQKDAERILLVDDDPSIVRLITQMLKRSGYEVIAKTSSSSALKALKETPEPFDLVISDMTMPEMSGEQLAQEIKQIRPGIPVVLCTGHSNRMDENRAKELGIEAFIKKPFSRKDITKTISKVLYKKQL